MRQLDLCFQYMLAFNVLQNGHLMSAYLINFLIVPISVHLDSNPLDFDWFKVVEFDHFLIVANSYPAERLLRHN